jgi:DNA-3-methyladenine glycosylase I
MAESPIRCGWRGMAGDPLYEAYHDTEWGVPEYDSRALWEKLVLDGFQAGLAWITILRKREAFRAAFDNFDPEKVAAYGEADRARLMADAGIVRNRAKIDAAIANAAATAAMLDAGESLAELVWSHAPGRRGGVAAIADLPAVTAESRALARELKRRGFRFVGPTTVYSTMQACGVVNDHLPGCWVRAEVERQRRAADL